MPRLFDCRVIATAVTATLVAAGPAGAASVSIGNGDRVNAPVTSFRALRDANLVRQQFDFSCGAAALATLLRYQFGDAVTEREILHDLFQLLPESDQALRRAEGFSLLDLQRVARARGYRAEGYRLTPESLSRLNGPVIVFIEPQGYKHFAVLRGTRGDRVYLADPSRGNIRLAGYRFLDSWLDDHGQGIIFVVEPQQGLPAASSPLAVPDTDQPQPEMLSARELLSVGSPFEHLPNLSR
ncbi:C39 family peptidase [Parahaliea maris]|uniref:C39 family peptidase n=1 Tax=Parahaliea maris TaxID=2716870 RepID=UPI00164FE236|nr:C39 family peptidase [Parahaliea maris]